MKSIMEMVREAENKVIVNPNLDWKREFSELVRADEREACAKMCENQPMQQNVDVRDQCASAIRAREKK